VPTPRWGRQLLEVFAIWTGAALLGALIFVGFRIGGRGAGAWAWSWGALIGAGGCTALSGSVPLLAYLAPVLGSQFAFFQLQLARQDAGLPLSRALLTVGLAFGLGRAALRVAGWEPLEGALSLAVDLPLIATAARFYARTHRGGRPALHVAAPAVIALILVFQGAWALWGWGIPWLAWALAGVPAAALQVTARLDRPPLERDCAEDAMGGSAGRAEPAAAAQIGPQARRTILVVDDDPRIGKTATRILRQRGFDAVAVQRGEHAVARLRDDPEAIDAVLLDLTMPRMDGFETFAALRRICPDLPVIVMSGQPEEWIDARLHGQDHLQRLQKPFRADLLEARLRDLLS